VLQCRALPLQYQAAPQSHQQFVVLDCDVPVLLPHCLSRITVSSHAPLLLRPEFAETKYVAVHVCVAVPSGPHAQIVANALDTIHQTPLKRLSGTVATKGGKPPRSEKGRTRRILRSLSINKCCCAARRLTFLCCVLVSWKMRFITFLVSTEVCFITYTQGAQFFKSFTAVNVLSGQLHVMIIRSCKTCALKCLGSSSWEKVLLVRDCEHTMVLPCIYCLNSPCAQY